MNSQLILELSLIGTLVVVCLVTFVFARSGHDSPGQTRWVILTVLLCGFLLMAGTVKFFEPFHTMFTAQVTLSGLPWPTLARWAGQLAEMSAGALLLASLWLRPHRLQKAAFGLATGLTVIVMAVAVHVHLQPGVPAEVLPLQSKPPVLALVIIGLAGLNLLFYRQAHSPV